MRIFKTLVLVNSEGRAGFHDVDTIEYQGKKWLVPEWIEAPSEGWKMPARIICLDLLPHEKMAQDWRQEFFLKNPIDKSVFDGLAPKESEYNFLIVEKPDIKIPIPAGIH